MMNPAVETPAKGSAVKASWAASVTSAINAMGSMGADGMLNFSGVLGNGASPLPKNLRERRSASALPTPFRLGSFVPEDDEDDDSSDSSSASGSSGSGSDEDEEEAVYGLIDCYYNYGGKTRKFDNTELDMEECAGKIVAFKLDFDNDNEPASIVLFDSLASMQSAQGNFRHYVFPLYLFDEYGSVKLDLRCAPQIQVFES